MDRTTAMVTALMLLTVSICLITTLEKLDRCERLQTSAMTGP